MAINDWYTQFRLYWVRNGSGRWWEKERPTRTTVSWQTSAGRALKEICANVTLQALSSIPANSHLRLAWSYKALVMFVDCMWSFEWRLEGRGREDSHKACNCLVISYHCSFIDQATVYWYVSRRDWNLITVCWKRVGWSVPPGLSRWR